MSLSDAACRNAKVFDSAYKLTDGSGLYLHVSARGSKSWRYDYRFAGKRRTLTFGKYPEVGLSKARSLLGEAKSDLADGKDPAAERKRRRQPGTSDTYEAVAAEYIDKLVSENRAPKTIEKNVWLLQTIAGPTLNPRRVRTITAPELLALIRPIEKAGKLETARRMRGTLGSLLRYAIATGRADRDVAADLKGAFAAPTVRHHPGITDRVRLAQLLAAIEGYSGHVGTQYALRIAPRVFLRPYELRTARWPEIDWNARLWRVPGAKMKMRRGEHLVPLSPYVYDTLEKAFEITGRGEFIFPATRPGRPLSENTMNAALRTMGFPSNEHVSHGFRTTATTLLNEQGWPPDWIEAQMAHVDRNTQRATYNAAQYLEGRRRMMDAWSGYLDALFEVI